MSNDIAFNDPCILFALRQESRPFLKEFPPQQRFWGAPCRARFCGPAWLTVLVLETGMGQAKTEQALNWLEKKPALGEVPYRPKLVLSAGFAGALQADHPAGDIILATEVIDFEGNCWPATWPAQLPSGKWRPPLHRGRIVTVDRMIGRPEEKTALGKKHDALAVDMESAAVARWCQRKQIPFGCVRAISDGCKTPLSDELLAVLATGVQSPLRAVWPLVRSPRIIREMFQLARQTRLAARQLALALGELLTVSLPWSQDV